MEKPRNCQIITLKRTIFTVIAVTMIFCIQLSLSFHDIYSKFTGIIIFYPRVMQEPDNVAMELQLSTLINEEDRSQLQKTGFLCNSDERTDICVTTTQVRINTLSSNIYISPNQEITPEIKTLKIVKPYPRKTDVAAMLNVQPMQIIQATNSSILPDCQHTHMVPALVFSTGGYAGNAFHCFNEVIVPLFLTSRHFRSQVQFIITDYNPMLVRRYDRIFKQLSSYEIILNSNSSNNNNGSGVHCFPGGVVGLEYHGFWGINSSGVPKGYKFDDFKEFLFESYNLKVDKLLVKPLKRPIVLLISRENTRMWLNRGEIVDMMVELGFEVRIANPSNTSNVERFSSLVNSCHVMVGVHGAGLTNQVFLPEGAVTVQVIPIGVEWPSITYFAEPASKMGLKNLEYHVGREESSLSDTYSLDDPVLTDPASIYAKDFGFASTLYLYTQNLKINVTRFRDTMSQAFQLLQH